MSKTPEKLPRPTSPAMDRLLGDPISVLDHGFIRIVDYMGDEDAIVQAARVSYGKGTTQKQGDRGLLRYLMSHRHSTPFEMCEIKLHVKLPMFVARQWIRHRTANVNEYSGRYSKMADEFYVPPREALQPQSKTNKQGREGSFPGDVEQSFIETIRQQSEGSYQLYEELSSGWPLYDETGERLEPGEEPVPHDGEFGLSRELARMVLPVNVYTEWYWKIDLHNLLHFLSLRNDPHAQAEIRAYAKVISEIVRAWLPNVHEAFEDYVVNARKFSATEMELLRSIVRGSGWIMPDIYEAMQAGKLTNRERNEFLKKLQIEEGLG